MSARTYVIGVGMTKFDKPGTKEGDYPDWAKEAGEKALADAGIPYEDVEQAYAGYCYGDSTYGQRALYQLGLTGIPIVNSTYVTVPSNKNRYVLLDGLRKFSQRLGLGVKNFKCVNHHGLIRPDIGPACTPGAAGHVRIVTAGQ